MSPRCVPRPTACCPTAGARGASRAASRPRCARRASEAAAPRFRPRARVRPRRGCRPTFPRRDSFCSGRACRASIAAMRIALFSCVVSLTLAACGSETPSPAQPQPPPVEQPQPPPPTPVVGERCATDADCVYSDATVCPECCHCARVMTVSEERGIRQRATVVDCSVADCSHMRCEPCATRPTRVVCESGACVGKFDGAPTPAPPGPEAATS